jgi:hypothetical protein
MNWWAGCLRRERGGDDVEREIQISCERLLERVLLSGVLGGFSLTRTLKRSLNGL